MRPFRSFLILLIFLVCLTGLFDIFPWKGLFAAKEADNRIPATAPVTTNEEFDNQDYIPTADSASPLKIFLDSLAAPGHLTRIMYYGDSQVEGDRLTFFLRQLLREGRGGTGPGLFQPLMPVMYTKTLWLRSSPNWKRYNYLSFRSGEISHKRLGPFMSVCRYLPEGVVTATPQEASIRIMPSVYSDSAASAWEHLRIFYNLKDGTVKINISSGDDLLLTDTLSRGEGIKELSCSIKGSDDILIAFKGKASPDIYGISIEGSEGVIVDNIPQRGSAGLEFTLVDKDNLREAYDILKPDLIVLHYGLNIVRNVSRDYDYYRKGLIRQISAIREAAPSTPVLLIGVTDMAHSEGDTISGYANIPLIIEAQKEAAKEAGAAFWDAYRAMGGSRSIVEWAEKSPPLAQDDLVHFTYPGADTLAMMMTNSLFKTSSSDTLAVADTLAVSDSLVKAFPDTALHDKNRNRFAELISEITSYNPGRPFIFTTPGFWLFLLLVLAGYSFIYKKLFVRNFYLLLVSLFFYYKTGGLFLLLLVLVTVTDYLCGLLIHRSASRAGKRLFILVSLLSNLGILAYFKYTGFIVDTINRLAGTDFVVYDFLASFSNSLLGTGFDINTIILPAGISFFTFQSLSYTFDIYRGKLEPVRNISDFGFYVYFFPQLVAGPIVRASEFIPQLHEPFRLSKREFSHSVFMISKGLIKKIIISDFLALNFVDRVFDMPAMYSGFENLMAVYSYGLQIYCDFSGYTDIAIGVALLLGFRLPVNFNSPYKATGISDFWRRWHISLSRWLKDYLYIPLGGNRKGKLRTGLNLMITMLLGGLWHGAALRFLLWGGLHGAGLVASKVWASLVGRRFRPRRIWKIIAVFLTFNFVSFCWIFFRAPETESALMMLKQIAENFSPGSYASLISAYSGVLVVMAAGYLIHFLPENVREAYRGIFIRIPLAVQLVLVMFLAVILIQMRTTEVMPFIYFRF